MVEKLNRIIVEFKYISKIRFIFIFLLANPLNLPAGRFTYRRHAGPPCQGDLKEREFNIKIPWSPLIRGPMGVC
jgi:hypothetical protein